MLHPWCSCGSSLCWNSIPFPCAGHASSSSATRGILLLYGFRAIHVSWASIEHCQWTKASGRLQMKPHRAKGPNKVWIRRRDVDEATAILRGHVEVRDLQGRLLNPDFSAAGRPAEPDVEQSGSAAFSSTSARCCSSCWWPVPR